MDSLQLLTLYLTRTPIFSGRGTKINLHTTPKLTLAMPISCLLPCADPGIFVGGGGGGGWGGSTAIWQFLVLSLFHRSQIKWLLSKKNIIFQGSGGGPNFPVGRGGATFSTGGGGVQLLIPY